MSKLRVAGTLSICAPEWFETFSETLSINKYEAGLDHQRHYKDVAFFQPYHAEGKHLLALLSACEQVGLVVHISGVSVYWPGSTFRIAIYRPQDEAQFHEYVGMTEVADVIVPMEENSISIN